MKNKLCMLFAIVLLIVGGCNEKSQNYFIGTILEITDNYFIVSPDDSEPIRETSDNILVPKEVVSANGIPVFPKQKDIKKQPMFTCLQTKEYCY